MVKVKVIKTQTTLNAASLLEDDINRALESIPNAKIIDIKITGSYDSQKDNYIALIIYED